MRLQQLEDDHFRFPDLNGALYFFHKKSRGAVFGQAKTRSGILFYFWQAVCYNGGDGLNSALTAFTDRSIFLSYIIAY